MNLDKLLYLCGGVLIGFLLNYYFPLHGFTFLVFLVTFVILFRLKLNRKFPPENKNEPSE